MVTAALCGGFVINQFRDNPLPLVYASKVERVETAVNRIAQAEKAASCPSIRREATEKPEVQNIDLAEFRQMIEENPNAIILDARPEIFHRLERVPGAISLPREDFEDAYKKQREVLEKDKTQIILVYCSGGHCEDGKIVSDALIQLGYMDVYLFKSGWHAWKQAKLPEERSQ